MSSHGPHESGRPMKIMRTQAPCTIDIEQATSGDQDHQQPHQMQLKDKHDTRTGPHQSTVQRAQPQHPQQEPQQAPTTPGPLHLDLPFVGPLSRMPATPTVDELKAFLNHAIAVAEAFTASNPEVEGMEKLKHRIRADLNFVIKATGGSVHGGSGNSSGAPAAPDAAATAEAVPPAAAATAPGLGAAAVAGGGEAAAAAPASDAHASVSDPPAAAAAAAPGGGPAAAATLSLERLQGIVNNLRGFQGELLAAQHAPGIVGVLKRFCPKVVNSPALARSGGQGKGSSGNGAKGKGGKAGAAGGKDGGNDKVAGASGGAAAGAASAPSVDGKRQQAPSSSRKPAAAAPGAAAGAASSGISAASVPYVEVDVVAQGGHTWIEAKNQAWFGLDSIHWTGSPGHAKGLKRQVEEMLLVASAPCNHRRWRAPSVVVFFSDACNADAGVVRELTAMGAHVALGPDSLRQLPPPPPAPTTINLDVTTMCALVSEMCWAPPGDPHVAAWSQKTVHWRDCLEAEAKEPHVPQLMALTSPGQRIIACDVAIKQFEKLLSMFGGPKEKARWTALRERLEIIPIEGNAAAAGGADAVGVPAASAAPAAGAAGDASEQQQQQQQQHHQEAQGAQAQGHEPLPTSCYPAPAMSPRVAALEKMGEQQKAVFGVGDTCRALTLTANGNAVRSAERQGVWLEAWVHRAVWLVGV